MLLSGQCDGTHEVAVTCRAKLPLILRLLVMNVELTRRTEDVTARMAQLRGSL